MLTAHTAEWSWRRGTKLCQPLPNCPPTVLPTCAQISASLPKPPYSAGLSLQPPCPNHLLPPLQAGKGPSPCHDRHKAEAEDRFLWASIPIWESPRQFSSLLPTWLTVYTRFAIALLLQELLNVGGGLGHVLQLPAAAAGHGLVEEGREAADRGPGEQPRRWAVRHWALIPHPSLVHTKRGCLHPFPPSPMSPSLYPSYPHPAPFSCTGKDSPQSFPQILCTAAEGSVSASPRLLSKPLSHFQCWATFTPLIPHPTLCWRRYLCPVPLPAHYPLHHTRMQLPPFPPHQDFLRACRLGSCFLHHALLAAAAPQPLQHQKRTTERHSHRGEAFLWGGPSTAKTAVFQIRFWERK